LDSFVVFLDTPIRILTPDLFFIPAIVVSTGYLFNISYAYSLTMLTVISSAIIFSCTNLSVIPFYPSTQAFIVSTTAFTAVISDIFFLDNARLALETHKTESSVHAFGQWAV